MSRFAASEFPPQWIGRIVVDVSGLDLFPDPPFRAAWMFGGMDRVWLEQVSASYQAELTRTIAEQGDPPGDESERRRVEGEVQAPYREMLREVARARFAASPEIRRRFSDGRRLADLPHESDQYRWLYQVLRRLGPHSVFAVGLNKYPEDMANFAATDLPELVRLSIDMQEAFLPYRDRAFNAEENDRLLRPFAERFQALVNSRKP